MTLKRLPIVGLTSSTIATTGSSIPPKTGQNQAYVRAVVRAGAAPLLIPPLTDSTMLRSLYQRLDGLLLAGGEDVDPDRYAELRSERCGRSDPERDEMELTLTRWAVESGKPLLAICRGIQVLNVALGGCLYQDIASQLPDSGKHDWYPDFARDRLSHSVSIDGGSRLAGILGVRSLLVNSLHHQAIKAVGPGLGAIAHAPDGLVEAVELADQPFALGVQWHPEELADGDKREQRLFDAWVEACRMQL